MGNPPAPKQQPVAKPDDPIDLSESVAGEEDPGASIDISGTPTGPGSRAKPNPAPDKDRPGGAS
ncbi:hypothetical protein LZ009_08040 [Ramlibacter sp. XY19]|uniref:hypothetical protein n=1 Tax=Ramlibacter paludis TaxID=2908000 RepID=UPI0023D9C4F2|nr:hypothetical protein [Ramlibacter paludis]MCG2592731.1 hypothetical protein [Ramlibacter paludis]